jgi:hypothetical protein
MNGYGAMVEWYWREKWSTGRETCHRHFVHHKSHIDWPAIEPVPSPWHGLHLRKFIYRILEFVFHLTENTVPLPRVAVAQVPLLCVFEMERTVLPSALVSRCCSFWILLLLLKRCSPLWSFGLQYSRYPFLPICGQRMPFACLHSFFCLLTAILNLSASVEAVKLSQSSISVSQQQYTCRFWYTWHND